MQVGQFFNPEGFHEVATMETDDGTVHVLRDDAGRLLVGLEADEAMTDGERSVELLAVHSGEWRSAYQLALTDAVVVALGRGGAQ